MVNDYIRIAGSAGTIERLEAAVTELVDNQTNAVAPATLRAAINSLKDQTAKAWSHQDRRCEACGGSGYVHDRRGVRYRPGTLRIESMTSYGPIRSDPAWRERIAADLAAGTIDGTADFAVRCGCRA